MSILYLFTLHGKGKRACPPSESLSRGGAEGGTDCRFAQGFGVAQSVEADELAHRRRLLPDDVVRAVAQAKGRAKAVEQFRLGRRIGRQGGVLPSVMREPSNSAKEGGQEKS